MDRIIKPFYINRSRYTEIESHSTLMVEGYYSGRAIKPGVGVVREFGRVPIKNMITNTGLDSIAGGGFATRMHLGTGTTPPSPADSTLANYGVVINSNPVSTQGNSGSAPYFGWRRLTWTSSVGGAAGVWTEIGVSSQVTSTGINSRSLILDSAGNPTSFPVQPDEQFQGTYEIRTYVPETDAAESVSISSTPYDTVTRGLNATAESWSPPANSGDPWFGPRDSSSALAYTGGLAPITATNPLGTSLGGGVTGSSTYQTGTYRQDTSMRWGSGRGVGVIRTVRLQLQSGLLQIEYTPAINKLTTEELILNQRVSWARR